MRRSFTHYLRLAAILTGICSTAQAAVSGSVKMQPGLKITLNVYNWSHVDSETLILIRAKQEAARIYREIGVETVRRSPHEAASAMESALSGSCRAYPAVGGTTGER